MLEIYKKKYRAKKLPKFKFNIGDIVRIKVIRDNPFIKSERRKFSADILTITGRKRVNNANLYYLKDRKNRKQKGSVNEQRLIKAIADDTYRLIVKKHFPKIKKSLVSWDGFPSSDDQLVNDSEIISGNEDTSEEEEENTE